MNNFAIQKINEVLKAKPLIYFAKEAERALGLEKELINYHICCVENTYIVEMLIHKGVSVFCLENEISAEEFKNINKSTATLISHPKTVEWINKITKGEEFYALTFLPSNVVNFKINKLGGILLNNAYELNLRFENKLVQADILESNNISKPKYLNLVISDLDYSNLKNEFGENFVVQTEKSHTGNGTFFIDSEEKFNTLKTNLSGNKIKITELIDGAPCTINCCIYKNKLYIGALQYQITGVPGQEGTEGVTIGNDFTYGSELLNNSDVLMRNLVTEISKIGQMLMIEKYRGLFGIDFIIKDNNIFVIEINSRQTANIPFQTKLELLKNTEVPMMAIHLSEFLDLDIAENLSSYSHIQKLEGSQIFVRSLEDNYLIKDEVKSGIYRLQSDNSANDWSKQDPEINKNVIFLDEEMDKPLIFQKDAYSIEDSENGFLILAQHKDSRKNKFDEVLRMQFKQAIIIEGKIKPWVLEMYKYFSRA